MSSLNVNTIGEYTTNNGVTIDGVLLKDSKIGGTITIPGSTGTLALTSDISSGLNGNQLFRLTTNTNSNTYLKLWEEPDNTISQGKIGSYVSVDTSTGYFSFSATGIYLVLHSALVFYNGDQTVGTQIVISDDNFSTSEIFASQGFGAGYYGGPRTTCLSATLDIQDTTNDKFAIYSFMQNTSSYAQGNTSQNMTWVQILRIGDT